MERQRFLLPDRAGLPAADRTRNCRGKTVGYTEASRGCKHLCRHCPIVPVYKGTFRVVQRDVVLGDIRAAGGGGARHITFGDPGLSSTGRGMRCGLWRSCTRKFPDVTYDVTIKVEHLLKHPGFASATEKDGMRFCDERCGEPGRCDSGEFRQGPHAGGFL